MVHLKIESSLRRSGYKHIAGVDEAGRGPLAGPVVAAAVILPPKTCIKGLNDSKKMTAASREAVFNKIMELAVCVGIGMSDEGAIDRTNILKATLLAMKKAVAAMKIRPDFILVDGNTVIPLIGTPQRAVVKGDGISGSIAAASVVAKVTRDRLMRALHDKYPQYGFASHKGYGTRGHIEALKKHGPCPAHRKTFAPVIKSS